SYNSRSTLRRFAPIRPGAAGFPGRSGPPFPRRRRSRHRTRRARARDIPRPPAAPRAAPSGWRPFSWYRLETAARWATRASRSPRNRGRGSGAFHPLPAWFHSAPGYIRRSPHAPRSLPCSRSIRSRRETVRWRRGIRFWDRCDRDSWPIGSPPPNISHRNPGARSVEWTARPGRGRNRRRADPPCSGLARPSSWQVPDWLACTPRPWPPTIASAGRWDRHRAARDRRRLRRGRSSYPACNRLRAPPRAASGCGFARARAARRRPLPRCIHPGRKVGIRCSRAPAHFPSSGLPSTGQAPRAWFRESGRRAWRRSRIALRPFAGRRRESRRRSAVTTPAGCRCAPAEGFSLVGLQLRVGAGSGDGRLGRFESRRRQDRRAIGAFPALLHFDFGKEHRRRGGGHGNLAGFRAADAVEDLELVARHDDVVQRAQRRADNIHAAHQFVRPPVRIDAPHHHRKNLKRLRRGSLRERKAALNILEIEAVRLALFFNFLHETLAKLGVRYGVRRGDDQISLATRGHQPRLAAAVTIRVAEAGDRHARHQEIFQDAILDGDHALRGDAFIVVRI